MLKPEIKNYGLDLFVPSLMTDLTGFIFIGLIVLITFAVSSRWPNVSKIIFTALTIRVLVILIGHYFVHLPDTKADALGYEWGAWIISQDGLINVFKNFTGPSSIFYSWIMAIPYSLFGRNVLILQSIGLFFGVGSVFLGWLLAKKIWDENTANKIGWVLALFPSLILYSIITLKEVYCSFFLLFQNTCSYCLNSINFLLSCLNLLISSYIPLTFLYPIISMVKSGFSDNDFSIT